MDSQVAISVTEYLGITSRLQSFQILGFLLGCSALVILASSIGNQQSSRGEVSKELLFVYLSQIGVAITSVGFAALFKTKN